MPGITRTKIKVHLDWFLGCLEHISQEERNAFLLKIISSFREPLSKILWICLNKRKQSFLFRWIIIESCQILKTDIFNNYIREWNVSDSPGTKIMRPISSLKITKSMINQASKTLQISEILRILNSSQHFASKI